MDEQQLAFFRTFGFVVLRNVFSSGEMDSIREEFDEVLEDDRAGESFAGQETQTILWFIERRERLSGLADDDRIYLPIEQILGPGFIWVLSDGNLYVGDTQWHGGDGQPNALQHVKVAVYPDPVTRETGCLRVIPGSHRPEFQTHLSVLKGQYQDPAQMPFGLTGADIPAFPLESNPGDVVFFSENLWHGSFGGRTGRRMFTLIYYENPRTAVQIDYLRDSHSRTIGMFHPHETFLNSNRP